MPANEPTSASTPSRVGIQSAAVSDIVPTDTAPEQLALPANGGVRRGDVADAEHAFGERGVDGRQPGRIAEVHPPWTRRRRVR